MDDFVGTWKLASAYFVKQSTGDRVDVLGASPFGFFTLDAGGRVLVVMTADPAIREAAAGDIAALFKSMICYTATTTFDSAAGTVSHRVDGAWDPSWVGTEQKRHFTFDGDVLSLRTTPLRHPSFPDDDVVGYVDWTREL